MIARRMSARLMAFIVAVIIIPFAAIPSIAVNSSSINNTSEDSLANKTLADYIGTEFNIYHVKRLTKVDEIDNQKVNLLYFITSDPFLIDKNLSLKGKASYIDEDLYVFEGKYNNRNIVVVVGDEGHFLIKVGDGTTGAYRMCNLSELRDKPPLTFIVPKAFNIKFKGQFGESEAYTKVVKICGTGAGATCTYPKNSSVQRVLINPYEVYYLELDGYRLEPPLRIRCSIPQYNDGLKAVYVEGFIPPLVAGSKIEKITLNEELAYQIIDLARKSNITVQSPSELIVKDVYLALAPGGMVIPVLVLTHENNVLVVGLTPDKPMFLASAGLTGALSGGDLTVDTGMRLDWESILSNVTQIHEHSRITELQLIGASLVAIAILVIIALRRLKT